MSRDAGVEIIVSDVPRLLKQSFRIVRAARCFGGHAVGTELHYGAPRVQHAGHAKAAIR
jgi:hypothetical protein